MAKNLTNPIYVSPKNAALNNSYWDLNMLIHYHTRCPLHSKSLKNKPEPPVHAIENGLESADLKLKENPTFNHVAHQML